MTLDQTPSNTAPPDVVAQVRRAKSLYAWLWVSPVLTLPTLLFLTSISLFHSSTYPSAYDPSAVLQQRIFAVVAASAAVLGSGLWHLILLFWALDQRSEFVRWHGRQALLLAGARTALALVVAVLISLDQGTAATLTSLILLALWLVGNLWGRGQATAGECSLMRWTGHTPSPSLRVTPAMHATHDALAWGDTLQHQGRSAEANLAYRKILVSNATSEAKAQAAGRLPMPGEPGSSETADILVAMLRFSADPGRRRAALAALDRAGLVEAL